MKKIGLIVFSLVLMCGLVFSLFACEENHEHNYVDGVCSCGEKESAANQDNNINAENWGDIFLLGDNWIFTQVWKEDNNVVPNTGLTCKREGDKLYMIEAGHSATYGKIDGDKLFDYHMVDGVYVKQEMEWTQETDENWDKYVLSILTAAMPSDFTNYKKFTYDSTNDVYFASEIWGEAVRYTNVIIKLNESNKIMNISAEAEEYETEVSITYGNAIVELPIVE